MSWISNPGSDSVVFLSQVSTDFFQFRLNDETYFHNLRSAEQTRVRMRDLRILFYAISDTSFAPRAT